jgi:RimJ/RimL family protein N-acetyltransferase
MPERDCVSWERQRVLSCLVSDRQLETVRLCLEPWDETHTRMLGELSSTPAVMHFIGTGTVWSGERSQEVAAAQRQHWADHGFGWYGAVLAETGQRVGFIALNFVGDGGVGLDPMEYEIGWWLAPNHWHRGLAYESAVALLDYAFSVLEAPSVVARIQPANAASIRVAERLGLTLDFPTTGRFGEAIAIYHQTRSDWQARAGQQPAP